VTNCTTWGWS